MLQKQTPFVGRRNRDIPHARRTFQWPGAVAFSVLIVSVAYMVVSIYRERYRK